jgi:probable rRNA maturation factor
MRDFSIINDDPDLHFDCDALIASLQLLDSCPHLSIPSGSVSIAFVDRSESARLHAEFFADPSATDVMTFPLQEDDYLGDIAVCPAIAAQACLDHHTSFAWELCLYVVHGLLHLSGMEDATDAGTLAMRTAEDTAMRWLQQHHAVPDFHRADQG